MRPTTRWRCSQWVELKALGAGAGFSLIELMIVVVLVATLATVAAVAYTKHVKRSRIVAGRAFIATIQARQETYYLANNVYCNTGVACPSTLPTNGASIDWPLTSPCSAGWTALRAVPDGNVAYFQYTVTASTAATNHNASADSTGIATSLGITNAPIASNLSSSGTTTTTTTTTTTATPSAARPWRAWYYVVAAADMDNSGACGNAPAFDGCTVLSVTSQNPQIISRNEGQ